MALATHRPESRGYALDGANRHYVGHLVAAGDVQAAEDIYAGNGMKLLAKGARVDASMQARLLEHKLQKPLEESVAVEGALTDGQLATTVEALLDRHVFLRALRAGMRAGPSTRVADWALSNPLRSLLTVYAQRRDRLEHAVTVALVAEALGAAVRPGNESLRCTLAIAGLLHDIGELYIDPAHLDATGPLDPPTWKHIVIHPLVGARVLRQVIGAGAAVADAVLHHHERLDGFGYPLGATGAETPLSGQLLATAEWLGGMLAVGLPVHTHAHVAACVMPGEFDREVLTIVARAAQAGEPAPADGSPLDRWAPSIQQIAGALDQSDAWMEQQLQVAGPRLRTLMRMGLARLQRMRTAFSSIGLDAGNPQSLLGRLDELHDPAVHAEVVAVVRELEWRMRELEREALLRADTLRAEERAVVDEMIRRLRGEDVGRPEMRARRAMAA